MNKSSIFEVYFLHGLNVAPPSVSDAVTKRNTVKIKNCFKIFNIVLIRVDSLMQKQYIEKMFCTIKKKGNGVLFTINKI